jgi:hypothetical protein
MHPADFDGACRAVSSYALSNRSLGRSRRLRYTTDRIVSPYDTRPLADKVCKLL